MVSYQIDKDSMANATKKEITPLVSVVQLICGLLQNQKMTMKELVDCLMSEPYNMRYTSMGLIFAALNSIKDSNRLRFSLRIDKQNRFAIETVFHTVLPSTISGELDS